MSYLSCVVVTAAYSQPDAGVETEPRRVETEPRTQETEPCIEEPLSPVDPTPLRFRRVNFGPFPLKSELYSRLPCTPRVQQGEAAG